MNKQKKKVILIIALFIIISIVIFIIAAHFIVIASCTESCECQYNKQNPICAVEGCSQTTLWDAITCKLTHLFN